MGHKMTLMCAISSSFGSTGRVFKGVAIFGVLYARPVNGFFVPANRFFFAFQPTPIKQQATGLISLPVEPQKLCKVFQLLMFFFFFRLQYSRVSKCILEDYSTNYT